MNSWELYADRRRPGRKFAKSRLTDGVSAREHSNDMRALELEGQQSFEFGFGLVETKLANKVKKVTANVDSLLPYSAWPVGELSEIRAKTDDNIFHLLLPLLSKLNAENRWITLISPPSNVDKKLFAYHGIDVSRVLLIHPKGAVDDTVTMNKALKNGTSGIVIMWTDQLPQRYVAQWRKSVKQGNCRGVIVNHDVTEHYSSSVALALDVQLSDKIISITSMQQFGKKTKHQSKRSFPIVSADTYAVYQRFSLAN